MFLFQNPRAKLSSPLLFEGDSNTAWGYLTFGWVKRALYKSGGRYFVPVGGDFAIGGATVSTQFGAGNSMQSRVPLVTAKIQQMKAKYGKCAIWFQIGTNGGNASIDLPILANVVAAYRSAGAKVYANTCPKFGQSFAYADSLNAWIRTAGNVDGYVDADLLTNTPDYVSGGAGGTHYNEIGSHVVGSAVANLLLKKISPQSIYNDFSVSIINGTMAGTSGTASAGTSGQVASGWTLQRVSGDGSVVGSKVTLNGKDAQQIVVTGGTSQTNVILSRTDNLAISLGDIIDAISTIQLSNITDASSVLHFGFDCAGAFFPSDFGAPINDSSLYIDPMVFRTYPITQAANGTSIQTNLRIYVAAGKSATITLSDVRAVKRDTSPYVSPINTVAPVVSNAIVGQSPSSTNGTWTATPTPTFEKQFYLGGTPIAANYVFVTGDIGKLLTCYVTATNAGGSATEGSAQVAVIA